MSIDLEGWYLQKRSGKKKDGSQRWSGDFYSASQRLDVIGANHDWGYSACGYKDENDNFVATQVFHDGTGPQWYNADETHTFMEQVELVIKNYLRGYEDNQDLIEVTNHFREEAKEFEKLSKETGRPIKSYWI